MITLLTIVVRGRFAKPCIPTPWRGQSKGNLNGLCCPDGLAPSFFHIFCQRKCHAHATLSYYLRLAEQADLGVGFRQRLIEPAKLHLVRFTMNKNDPQLESDLKDMLGDYRPRQVGEQPRHLGDYQRIAPDTKIHQHVQRLKSRIIRPMEARR